MQLKPLGLTQASSKSNNFPKIAPGQGFNGLQLIVCRLNPQSRSLMSYEGLPLSFSAKNLYLR